MFAISTYRAPARLFVLGGMEVKSFEGTTQGNPLAMSRLCLIFILVGCSSTGQCWYADDATVAGALEEVRKWWDQLVEGGPSLGYHLNAKKCWLVEKTEKERAEHNVFVGSGINITTEGRKHLGAALS